MNSVEVHPQLSNNRHPVSGWCPGGCCCFIGAGFKNINKKLNWREWKSLPFRQNIPTCNGMAGAEAIAFFQALGNESRVRMFLCLRFMEAHLDLPFLI